MKYRVEIPDGKFCDEGEPCVFLVNAEHDHCQLLGDDVELDRDADEFPRYFVKPAGCPQAQRTKERKVMANYSVKRLTEEEIAELRKLHPGWDVKEFKLVDEQGSVADWFDSEEDAQSFRDDLTKLGLVEDSFRNWAQKTADEIGMDRQEVISIARESTFD